MSPLHVSAVIRTRNSAGTLPEVLLRLVRQTSVDWTWVVVDDGSTDGTLGLLPDGAEIVRYGDGPFSYSRSLNLAIPRLRTPYALIVSSHTVVEGPGAIRWAVELLEARPEVAAVCFSGPNLGEASVVEVDARSFDGWNGTWNTASLLRTSLLRERPFRLEVMSAEDQEWSRWALFEKHLRIVHVDGFGMRNLNPRRLSPTKRLREWEYVAAFSYPGYLEWSFILGKFREAMELRRSGRREDASFARALAWRLARVRLFGAHATSSAYD